MQQFTHRTPRRRLRAVLGALVAVSLAAGSLAVAPASATSHHELFISSASNRANPAPLQDATAQGVAYIFLAPDAGAKRVVFWLDDPAMAGTPFTTENNAPWDFAGGNTKDGTAKPFDTATISDGEHTVTARVTLTDNSTLVVNATFTVANNVPRLVFDPANIAFTQPEGGPASSQTAVLAANTGTATFALAEDTPWLVVEASGTETPATVTITADPAGLAPGTYTASVTATADGYLAGALTVQLSIAEPSVYDILVSAAPDRSNPQPLTDAVVTGNMYVFTGPDTGVLRVRFWIDNPAMSGTPYKTENGAPYDLAGSAANGAALPFDTTTLTDGQHTVTARITPTSGSDEVLHAAFEVANSAPALQFDPALLAITTPEGGAPTSAAAVISTNNGDAGFTLAENTPWLAVTPGAGTTPASLTVDVDPTGLEPGVYEAPVTATADGYLPATLTVRLSVTGENAFDIFTSASALRTDPQPLTGSTVTGVIYAHTLPEAGASRVLFWLDNPTMSGTPFTTENNAPWDFAGGFNDGTAKPYDTSALADGQHTISARIELSAGGVEVVHATFTSVNHQTLSFSPALIDLAGDDEPVVAQSQLSSTTGDAVDFAVTENATWLEVAPAAGTTPAQVTLTADPSGLSPGVYTATVTATSTTLAPGALSVRLTVGFTGGCEPLACSEILIDVPYQLGWDSNHGKILDKHGVGTGFTYVDPTTNGTGYVRENLEVVSGGDESGQGELRIATTAGIASESANSLDNGLAVGIDAPSQVTLMETEILDVPRGTGKFEQAGLWFGNDEDTHVKLVVISRTGSMEIEYLYEENGSRKAKTAKAIAGLDGSDAMLRLSADPVTRKITASYAIDGGGVIPLGSFLVSGEMFSFDAAGIDPTIGTRSFGGIFATHRNATTPLTYRFDRFVAAQDPGTGPNLGSSTFDRVSFPVANPTSMAWGPDNRLYVTELFGKIHAITLDENKAVVSDEVISTLGTRLTLGLTVDPASTPENVILWAAHSNASLNNGAVNSSTVTKLEGPGFATRTDVITGLPRAIANHAINSIHFGPDGRLYVAMGGNTGAGAANEGNTEFGDRAEQPLSAALLVADVKAAGFDGSCANETDMYGPAPCDVVPYSTGLRNMYDFVFHSNGEIYGPDNGLGVTGTFPPNPTPPCDGFGDPTSWTQGGDNPGSQPDLLLRLEEGKYFGHPNPSRDECVFKNGSYQGVGAPPDYVPPMHVLGNNKSSNGIVEYQSDAFCGALNGELFVANYSVGDDITRIKLSPDGTTVERTATLAGGFKDPLPLTLGPDGTVFVGELGASRVTALVPIDVGCWSDRAPLPDQLLDASGAALDGKFYVVAGKVSSNGHRTDVLVYDPATDTWSTSVPPAPGPGVEDMALTTLGGKLYAFGGSTAPFSGSVTNASVYDPATNSWTALAPMPSARAGAIAEAVGGLIYVGGGRGDDGASLATVSVFNPATNTWANGPAMTTRRDNAGSAVLGGNLYVFGGRTRNANGSTENGVLNTVEMLDIATGTWTPKASMPTGRRALGVAVLNGRALVMGGEVAADGTAFAANEEYDPLTDSWRQLAQMKTPRHGIAAAAIGDTVYVAGGGPTGGFAVSNIHEAFRFESSSP